MSVRECIGDVLVAHNMAGKVQDFNTNDMSYRIRVWMEQFCDDPFRLYDHKLRSTFTNEDANGSEIALEAWKDLMGHFYELTIHYITNNEFEVPELMLAGVQELATTIRKNISPFRKFLEDVRRCKCECFDCSKSTAESMAKHVERLKEVSELLSLSVDVTDFYYRFHCLRSACQSPETISALLESDDAELQAFVDSSIFDNSQFKQTKIYFNFRYVRDTLLYTLARKRGVVPSSFYVVGIIRQGDHPIGLGGCADVWTGCVRAHSTIVAAPSREEIVALKVLKQFDSSNKAHSDLLKALCREAVLWKMTNHPNVHSFIGICKLDDARLQTSIALASPYMRNGNLSAYVKKHAETNRATLLKQILHGLIYLHDIGVIHGDLKCSNVLVNDEGVAQLSDFGLSSVGNLGESINQSISNSAGNPRWLAPELIFPDNFNASGRSTRESDVYAFGMTALELFTGKVPFFDLPDPAIPLEVALKGSKPSWPGKEAEARGLTREYWKVMERCWHQEPELRPKTHLLSTDRTEFITSSSNNLQLVCFFPWISLPVSLRGRIMKFDISRKRGWFTNAFIVAFDETLSETITVSQRITDGYCQSEDDCKCSQFEKKYVVCRLLHNFETYKTLNTHLWRLTWCHPNVAPTIGYCKVSLLFSFGLVYDIGLNSEPLLRYLYRHPMKNRLRIMEEISRGLNYLHQLVIMHGDLRCANIVVERGTVRLVDYALPTSVREDRRSFERQVFQAPELMGTSDSMSVQPTRKTDVYSLAMTFCEILTEEIPFTEDPRPETDILNEIVENEYRPEYPGNELVEKRGFSSGLWALMSRCWSADFWERPFALYVADRIQELRNIDVHA